MHGKKMTVAEWQAVYDSFDLDVDKCDCLLDPRPATVDELIEQYEPYGHHLMYVKWKDRQLCLDSVSGWQIFDMKVADPDDDGFYLPLSPEFDSLAVALDYPVLDGKSIRDRFDECRFFGVTAGIPWLQKHLPKLRGQSPSVCGVCSAPANAT